MTDTIKSLAPVIWKKLNKARSILTHIHRNPDTDSFGAALGLQIMLEDLGKTVTVLSTEDISPNSKTKFLPGFDKVQFKKFSEVDLKKFDVFVSLDSDTPSRITSEPVNFPLPIPTIVIDHHRSNTKFGDINLVETHPMPTCEILYWLAREWKIDISADAATCLYAGIAGDSGGFKFKGMMEWQTLQAASDLVKQGAKFYEISRLLTTIPNGHLRVLGAALSRAKEYFNHRVLVSRIYHSDAEEFGIPLDEITEIYKMISTNIISQASDAQITAVIYPRPDGHAGISLRTDNFLDDSGINVLDVAKKFPGGGGHRLSSGAVYAGTLVEAEKKLIQIILETFPELGQP